jgi:hypothetical protein
MSHSTQQPSHSATLELVERMLSPEVQVQIPVTVEEVEAKLTSEQVAEVFAKHVPGVRNFLFRQQYGQYVIRFMQMAYQDGFRAFKGTPLEDHLKWLFRLIVHYGQENKPDASRCLTEVAEAFMDCQAVQARVVERLGLQIRGVTANFKGLVKALIGEYKTMALKMLAVERISERKARDDATPTHYENRLAEDIGEFIGLNADDIRRASLDEHARARFACLSPEDAKLAAFRCRELFDFDAFLQAFMSELNSFSAESPANSMSRSFLDWASQNLLEKHVVFDEDTCTRVEIGHTLAMAVLEVLLLGRLKGLASEEYRDMTLHEIFCEELRDVTESIVESSTNAVMVKVNEEATPTITVPSRSTSMRKRRANKHSKNSKAKRHHWEESLLSAIPAVETSDCMPMDEVLEMLENAARDTEMAALLQPEKKTEAHKRGSFKLRKAVRRFLLCK